MISIVTVQFTFDEEYNDSKGVGSTPALDDTLMTTPVLGEKIRKTSYTQRLFLVDLESRKI